MDHLIAARPDARTAHSYWTMQRGDSERAFRQALRHSRSVRRLRILIPALVVLLIGGFAAWTWFNPMRLLLKVPDIGGDLVISGTKITMQQPRVTGFTRDSRPYEFSAQSAAQDLTRPDIVELNDLHGKFEMQDKSTTEMTADGGTYNSKQEMLNLGSHIVVTSTSGYKILLKSADIDIHNARMTTDDPVQIEMKQGRLDAKGMEVRDAGGEIVFSGVTMTINPNELSPPAGAPARSSTNASPK